MEAKGAHFSSRRVAVEICRAKVPIPIENVWSWMEKQLSETFIAINMVDWKRKVTELWVLRMSDSQYLRNLVESMSRRLEDVISREENPTKY